MLEKGIDTVEQLRVFSSSPKNLIGKVSNRAAILKQGNFTGLQERGPFSFLVNFRKENSLQTLPNLPRLAWGFTEISAATGLSVPFLRKMAREGALSTKKIGGRVLVLDQDLRQFLNGNSEKEEASAHQ